MYAGPSEKMGSNAVSHCDKQSRKLIFWIYPNGEEARLEKRAEHTNRTVESLSQNYKALSTHGLVLCWRIYFEVIRNFRGYDTISPHSFGPLAE